MEPGVDSVILMDPFQIEILGFFEAQHRQEAARPYQPYASLNLQPHSSPGAGSVVLLTQCPALLRATQPAL